jgi:hypothetical protein
MYAKILQMLHQNPEPVAKAADALAGTAALAAVFDLGPTIAAWFSAIWFASRFVAAVRKAWRRRKGACPSCGEH